LWEADPWQRRTVTCDGGERGVREETKEEHLRRDKVTKRQTDEEIKC
jgi:hypothetical protein